MERQTQHAKNQLAYRVRGQGAAVLFIQGVNCHGDGWQPLVERLCHQFTCISFDHRGIGASERGSEPVSVGNMARDALTVLDAAGVESAHLVGHSLGGPIAIECAIQARSRVRSLSLLCTFANGRAVGPLSWRLISAGLRMQLGTRRMRRRAFLELVVPPGRLLEDRDALAERLAPLFGHDLADQPPVVRDQMKAMRAYDATIRLGELSGLPTLVASAEHDPIAPPKLGRTLTAGIPGAESVELEGASHGVILTEPDRVAELLTNHWTRHPETS